MARIMAIDYGVKRCGIAVTDPLQIIAAPLDTVETANLQDFLSNYLQTELVECIVIGEARLADGSDNPLEKPIALLLAFLQNSYPAIRTARINEHGSSQRAQNAILQSGVPKMKRRDKGMIDQVSAALLLQQFTGLY